MRLSKLFLLAALMLPCGLRAQSSPQGQPLTDPEKRQILSQLIELEALRSQVAAYQSYIEREQAQDERERQNYERSLELERQATELARRERDLQAERAAMYESLWKAATKKPKGVKYALCKVFTLGIARCGT